MGEAGLLLAECRAAVEGRTTVQALQDLRLHAAAMVAALAILVGGEDHLAGKAAADAHVQLYGEWVDRSARVEKIAADLGLEERRVQVDETIASLVVAKVLETFVELGQDPGPYVALLAPKLAALDAVSTTGVERG